MAAVLGVSCHYHDAAVALVVDGVPVAALQEERVSRVKHDPGLPLAAAREVLALAGLEAEDLDRVVFYEDPYAKVERVLVQGVRGLPGSWRFLSRALVSQLSGRLGVLDALARGLGVPRARVGYVEHHESHAASAFYTSGWPEASVLTVDGVGEWATTSIWRGSTAGLQRLAQLELPHSLGLLYAAITGWLGFPVNGGECRVMGLASYGEARHREVFGKLVQAVDDGSFVLDPVPFGGFLDPERGYGDGLCSLLGDPRAPGRPWALDDDDFQHWADVAASLQATTEDLLLGLVRRAHALTGASRLCLAGGVALNAVANRRIAAEGPFAEVFVHPAAGDAGGALGAAFVGSVALGDTPGRFTPFLGQPARAARTADVARALGLAVRTLEQPGSTVAQALADGELVGVCTGRCEWGPRALGNRSLLGEASRAATRDRLNDRVKHREPFRPFAPAVRVDRFGELFEGEPDAMTPYMTTVRAVRRPEALAAVAHVDGTARVQSVDPGTGLLSDVLAAGSGVVLNTSLNGGGEPICGTGTDALSFFVRHRIDRLVVDDVEITRP